MAQLSEDQRRRQLAALLSCGGWSIFEDELRERLDCANMKIQQETFYPVVDSKELNLAISQRNGIRCVFDLIAEYRDELAPSENSPDEA